MTDAPQSEAPRDGEGARPSGPTAGGTAASLRIVVLSGMSGAGKTVALKAIEDMGYETVDNLPLSLIPSLIGPNRQGRRPLAIGVDSRTRDFAVDSFLAELDTLGAQPGIEAAFIFLDCDDEVLRRRYSETRHRHPLAEEGKLTEGIARERALLGPLMERADHVIDTSTLNLADIKHRLERVCALDDAPGMEISVLSFSYRKGLPPEADMVFDVRFLRNPHYVPDLAGKTGRDRAVGDYVRADPAFDPFFRSLTAMFEAVLPRFSAEGKSYLTIAFGCTGGKHRSVFVTETLSAWLKNHGQQVIAGHRDLAGATDS